MIKYKVPFVKLFSLTWIICAGQKIDFMFKPNPNLGMSQVGVRRFGLEKNKVSNHTFAKLSLVSIFITFGSFDVFSVILYGMTLNCNLVKRDKTRI